MYNYTLKYRTFDQLLSDVTVDLPNISLENMFEPQQLIKIARKLNYDLGLRINQTKETILEVEKGRVKLPDDFYTLNFALICDSASITTHLPQGTHMQEIPYVPYQETSSSIDVCAESEVNCGKCEPDPNTCLVPETTCTKPRVFMNCKGESYELIQVINPGQTVTYSILLPIKILDNPQNIECDCPNLYWNTANTAWIKDGFLYTNFTTGKVYLNYQGMMEDDQGNLLVPDHELINEYYEYAIKQRIFENMFMNDETGAERKLQLIEARLRAARNNALSLVNTPNFSELKKVFDMNRKAMYGKYYSLFKSY
jgi:hypothetical protein